MKKPVFLYALAFGLAIASGASAQESDDYAQCAQLLNSPPLDTLLTRNEGKDYAELNSDRLGAALLGVKCSRDQIVEYFLSAGWEFKGEDQISGESGPASGRYMRDYGLAFLKPRKLSWRSILGRYNAESGISMFDGRITRIGAGFYK